MLWSTPAGVRRSIVSWPNRPSPASSACDGRRPFVLSGRDGKPPALHEVDPTRVYSIDYLFAEPRRDEAMSRWGHAMLRVVMCAPGRPVGPACRLDLQHHLVLSFRAFVEDVRISSWKGLTGDYSSRLCALPLEQVVDEYTKVELRGLQFLPLALTPAEIASVLERAAQVHWSYDGRYYFVSNNCAVETFKLLHDAVPRLAEASLASLTPTGLLSRLDSAGVLDATVLQDAAEALRLGYRFESRAAWLESMLQVAREELPLPVDTAEDWLALTPAERAPWMAAGGPKATAALLLLEDAALQRLHRQAKSELARNFDRPSGAGDALARGAVDAWLKAQGRSPAALVPGGGYGLPLAPERMVAQGARQEAAAAPADMFRHLRSLLAWPLRQSLEDTERNVEAARGRLQLLHPDRLAGDMGQGQSRPPLLTRGWTLSAQERGCLFASLRRSNPSCFA